ncbi:sensor histidine kinase [Anaerolentibacter hominis]|uniref:sensor histidine kinase n=1 Tax=Anaerolentibacter hominis TaxID=3079009 RepID=UPI0031B8B32D
MSKVQENYYKDLRISFDALRSLRHDIRNHLIVVEGFLASGKTEEARKYIKEINGMTGSLDTLVLLDNTVLSALLTTMKETMLQNHVAFHYDIRVNRTPFSDVNLCIILGNLLQNAAEAAAELPEGTGYVDLQITRSKSLFMIHIENNYVPVPDKKKRSIQSRKKETKHQGIGLINIRKTLESYQGVLTIHESTDSYIVEVTVPIGNDFDEISQSQIEEENESKK